MTSENPLLQLKSFGQSIWLDDIRRRWLADGTLARLIAEDGITGITSNPAIFHKAVTETHDYDISIAELAERNVDAQSIYEKLIVEDVRNAANLFRRTHEESQRHDGYVSLEVSPHLAQDTEATFSEAMRLWTLVKQPNLMIKVPGTREGLPAIRRLLAAGINVNVTLLFSVARYCEVIEAWLGGLEDYDAGGQSSNYPASVASFFLSRIDTLVDMRLESLGTGPARELCGQAAIACARLAYQEYQAMLGSRRWKKLKLRGAHPQRLLWASTSAKNPAYADTKYVDALIGANTVNTLPFETIAAYRDHGNPALRLEQDIDRARVLPVQLMALGIELNSVSDELERQGVRKFVEPFDRLLAVLAQRAAELGA